MSNEGMPSKEREQLRDVVLQRLANRTAMHTAPATGSISFSAPLVRALLDGIKTQTRRAIRPQPDVAPNPGDCPIAQVGDVLYVREPWRSSAPGQFQYAADGPPNQKYRPAMYMPREAARVSILIERITVERLQAITTSDLLSEGLTIPPGDDPRHALSRIWNTFYPPGLRWEDNPFVWALHFSTKSKTP